VSSSVFVGSRAGNGEICPRAGALRIECLLKTDSGHRKDARIEFVQVSSRVAFGMKTVTAAGIPLLVFFLAMVC